MSTAASGLAPLTPRQQQVLGYIRRFVGDHGYPPTLREIGRQLQIRSTNGVNDHLKALERKGYLRRDDLKSRALRPVARERPSVNDNARGIPIVGRVAAGEPLLAVEQADESILLDAALFGESHEVIALHACGDSMIGDGIFDGDLLFVRRQPSARAGEIVVALIDEEATVKRYYPEKDRIRLQPSNDALSPIIVRRDEMRAVELIGVVVGIYRRL